MKKLIKIAVILLVAGVIIFGVGFAFMKFDFSSMNTMKTETVTYYADSGFWDIEIDGGSSRVTVMPWDGDHCKIVCTEAEKITHTVTIENCTLRITEQDNRSWREYIGIFMQDMAIDVYLPQNKYEDLKINNSSGGIVISEGFCFEYVSAKASSGGIKVSGVSATDIELSASSGGITAQSLEVGGTLTLDINSGGIKLSDVKCTDVSAKTSSGGIKVSGVSATDIELSASSGGITAQSLEVGGTLTLDINSGGIKLSDVKCTDVSVEAGSGSVTLSNVIAFENMKLKTSSGSVKLKASDAENIEIKTGSGSVSGTLLTNKIFVTDTGSGSVSVPNSFEGGKCYIKTGSGSIKITVSDDK